MPHQYSRYIPLISLLGDFVLLNVLYVIGFCLRFPDIDCMSPVYLAFFAYLNLSWLVLVIVFGAHLIHRNTGKKAILYVYIRIIVFFFFLFLMFFQVIPLSYYARNDIGFLFILFFVLLMGWKMALYYSFLLYRKYGFNYRNVVILGRSGQGEALQAYFRNNQWHGYRFLGFIDQVKDPSRGVIGSFEDLDHLIVNRHVDEVYVSAEMIPAGILEKIAAVISNHPARVRIIPELGHLSFKGTELVQYGTVPVIQIHTGPLGYWYNRLAKRVFDLFVSLMVMLTVLSWMIPLLYVYYLLVGGGPVFFCQKRTRIDGRVFTCIKFRSMQVNTQADQDQARRNDPRVTPMGRFLRRFSLDELPQFFNVIRGDMSVVGPRPHMLKHTEEYRKLVKRFMLRHTVKPGITGLAQVNGFRGEITSRNDIENRVRFDMQYIENWSLSLDLKIMLLTIWVIVKGQLKAY